jgi:hypothetical protein
MSHLNSADKYEPTCISPNLPLYLYFLLLCPFGAIEALGIVLLLGLKTRRFYRIFFGSLLILLGCGFISVGGDFALEDQFFWLSFALRGKNDPHSDGKGRDSQNSHGKLSVPKLDPQIAESRAKNVKTGLF